MNGLKSLLTFAVVVYVGMVALLYLAQDGACSLDPEGALGRHVAQGDVDPGRLSLQSRGAAECAAV
jgi:hypothetical protein